MASVGPFHVAYHSSGASNWLSMRIDVSSRSLRPETQLALAAAQRAVVVYS